jgi:hypothetical protein
MKIKNDERQREEAFSSGRKRAAAGRGARLCRLHVLWQTLRRQHLQPEFIGSKADRMQAAERTGKEERINGMRVRGGGGGGGGARGW